MRVLFVTRKYPPRVGGMESLSYGLTTGYPEPKALIARRDEKPREGDNAQDEQRKPISSMGSWRIIAGGAIIAVVVVIAIEIPSGGIEISGNLFHCIANEHERANLVPSILDACMSEHSADLSMTSAAIRGRRSPSRPTTWKP